MSDNPWKTRRIVAFDTETTGLDAFGGDRVIEFAAVEFDISDAGEVLAQREHAWFVNPGMPIPRVATEVSGISDKDVADAKGFDELALDIHELLSDAVTVAHNYEFDRIMLTREFERAGLVWPDPLAEIDTLELSHRVFPEARKHKLSDLCERTGVSLDGAHRAANDAAACGRCFVELVRRHDVPDDLQRLLDWSNAVGQPPDEGAIRRAEDGRAVFAQGDHAGKPVGDEPIHLAWMEKARVRGADGWGWRFPDATRTWARRWLNVRAAGHMRAAPKGVHVGDWGLDSCIAPDRVLA